MNKNGDLKGDLKSCFYIKVLIKSHIKEIYTKYRQYGDPQAEMLGTCPSAYLVKDFIGKRNT